MREGSQGTLRLPGATDDLPEQESPVETLLGLGSSVSAAQQPTQPLKNTWLSRPQPQQQQQQQIQVDRADVGHESQAQPAEISALSEIHAGPIELVTLDDTLGSLAGINDEEANEPPPRTVLVWKEPGSPENRRKPRSTVDSAANYVSGMVFSTSARPPLLSTKRTSNGHLLWEKAKSEVLQDIKAQKSLKADFWALVQSMVIFQLSVMLCGTALFGLERDSLYEQTKDSFKFAARVHPSFCAWLAGWYVSALAAHRVGYGDVIPTTTYGKGIIMLCTLFTTPLSVIFTMKLGGLLKRALDIPARRYIQKHGDMALNAFYVVSMMCMLAVIMTIAMLGLAEVWENEHGETLSLTDAYWFTWSSYTTVGYGDINFINLPSVTLGSWIYQYSCFIFGAAMTDTLLSWAYGLLHTRWKKSEEPVTPRK